MTKADIVEMIYERVGFSKKESAELVETVFDVIKDALVRRREGEVLGLWELHRAREERAQGSQSADGRRDPAGEARRVLTFKPSLVLKTVLNEDPRHARGDLVRLKLMDGEHPEAY